MQSQTNQKISQLGNQCQLGELGLGFAAGLVVLRFSLKKKVYYGRYNTYIWILSFYVARGTRDWVDGSRWVWMTHAINSTCHQSWHLGFVLAVGPQFL